MQTAPEHQVDPTISYEDVLAKLNRCSGSGIEQRFEIGKLAKLAMTSMKIDLAQLSQDTGYSTTTLRTYMSVWDFWGEHRIPGPRVVWQTYTQHLAFKKVEFDVEEYKALLMEGGRDAADKWRADFWQKTQPPAMSEEAMRSWRIRGATQSMWNTRVQLQLIDFKDLSPEERSRFAEHFKALISYGQEFRKAVSDQ